MSRSGADADLQPTLLLARSGVPSPPESPAPAPFGRLAVGPNAGPRLATVGPGVLQSDFVGARALQRLDATQAQERDHGFDQLAGHCRKPLSRTFWPALAALALTLPAPALAQDQSDTLRIDSLMTIVADRMQSGALAAAREDADTLIEANNGLFGYGGVFVDILGELAEADCSQAPSWVQSTAQPPLHRY